MKTKWFVFAAIISLFLFSAVSCFAQNNGPIVGLFGKPVIVKTTFTFHDGELDVSRTDPNIDFGAFAINPKWYVFTYTISGLPVSDHKSCKNPANLIVGNTDFGLGSSAKQDKFIEVDWKSPISNRFCLELSNYRVRPTCIVEIDGISVDATGKSKNSDNASSNNGAGNQIVTDNESFRKAFVGFGGTARYSSLFTDFHGAVAGGKDYLYYDFGVGRSFYNDVVLGVGYQGRQMKFPNESRLKFEAAYLELMVTF